ncbi:hypothetical protein F7734_28290 [Scytonema sp. UIC 10036]|uniref:hypothetical protein n=1 Tax=Scytonema sp. UIC 10036 TaxID=2304196 RepID=UPI0012DA7AD0|nr:hypothetical protein [Scytonema sp. UIC 10036]MUG96036.1 hypothetical protein [Scytonema sp. UIC 10036]
MVNGEFWSEGTPEVNAVLEPVTPERTLAQAFSLPLDSQLHFSITQKGQAIAYDRETILMQCSRINRTNDESF